MKNNYLQSQLQEQESTQQTLNFEYSVLSNEARTTVQKYTNEIKTLMRRASQDIIDIGQKLIEVKQHLGHGNFIKWLKSEFNWSVSTATKFMQVGEQFKFVNFTNLNITASALYLIAAPATPNDARAEVLQRASLGENITYTKAKAIVCKYKKNASSEASGLVAYNNTLIQLTRDGTSVYSEMSELAIKKTDTEISLPSKKDSLPSTGCQEIPIKTTIEDTSDSIMGTVTDIVKPTTADEELSDSEIAELAIKIKKMTPQQLAEMIIKLVNRGLSTDHLEVLITVSEQALKSNQFIDSN